tara:strand:+ start:261 stop:1193 length:933 start_codon:yes stop_codon:yes gene_type:complete
MKVALIEVYPNKKLKKHKAIDAHLRNAIILSDYLEADLLCVESDFIKAHKKKYDVLVLCFATHYAPFKMIKKLVENNQEARKIVISNDVNFVSSIGGFRPYTLIAGYDCQKNKSEIAAHTLNINLLLAKNANNVISKKYDCIYYGTFRKDRKNYFQEYLQDDIYLSTSPKNFKKYKAIGCNPKYISKLSWQKNRETLNLFKYQLYIEDNKTNTVFCNLANRYYEAGFCNNVVFFDSNCRNTINKSELKDYKEQVEFYIVKDYKDLQEKIKECNKNFEKHLAIQKSWRVSEQFRRTTMMKELKNIIYNEQK